MKRLFFQKNRVFSAVVMLLLSTVPIAGSHFYRTPVSAKELGQAPAAWMQEQLSGASGYLASASELKRQMAARAAVPQEVQSTQIWQPQADALNLAHFFPEGADTSDPSASYAAMAYQELMKLEENWMASIHRLSGESPAAIAARLGVSDHGYTSFRNIQIAAVDGDGRPITTFSNVPEIMSMASVYTYYRDPQDYHGFIEYAKQLWELSHSYTCRISDVYTCSGCLNEETEDAETEVTETAEAESGAAENAESESGAAGSEEAENGVTESGEVKTAEAEHAEAKNQETEGGATKAAVAESQETEGGTTKAAAAESQETEGGATKAAVVENQEAESGGAESSPISGQATPADAASEGTAPENAASANTASGNAASTDTASISNVQQDTGGGNCPGHIDLIVQARVTGLNGSRSLFALDSVGNDPSGISETGWSGWTEENKEAVRALYAQDWYDRYGIITYTLSAGDTLTAAEVEAYLAELPDGLSPTRKSLIRFALESVGRVPYYWGGKASRSGYEGNRFGAMVSPDPEGRILKGLDCSGWISWIYWSVTGTRLPFESTAGMSAVGIPISKEDLQPGDILFRTGDNAHAILFLNWTEDGRIRCIHESSDGPNNVTISFKKDNWQYYRRLVE